MKKLLLVLFLAAGTAMGQTAYVASEALLQSMPEYQVAQQEIQKLAASLQADDKKAESNAREKMAIIQKRVQELSKTAADQAAFDKDIKPLEDQAKAIETELVNSKKNAEKRLVEMQQKFMGPITMKLNKAIEKVSIAKGFKMVIDISAVAYATEDINISKDVALELGIPLDPEGE
ncbi:periplasmic chaperone for outer membrane proteins Skp [Nonlabens dokdonensis]|jgi:outer membrane protein|uniref:Outer membrane protein n=2 Tax=Nonlabens dokdonensis TaxID=328515 RepID=L7WAN1_NONDD|nr:OmpH family outer membrane protein [Nonlabens dokdonensis]AGC77252.1 outer membrane protein [Nonlabens dokdonensis DSW-6]PZX40787.1 periplasmic chaperone for outer membrane proteins Skp [Nonlabens dokdonensis]